jgi:arsenate reductase-like glutaredoxin family protein
VQSTGRDPIEGTAALTLLEGVNDLYVAQGRKIVHIDLGKDRPSDDELLAMVLGRSGTLRAPSIRKGKKLIVGYSEELLHSTLL